VGGRDRHRPYRQRLGAHGEDRAADWYGLPAEAVTAAKQRRLRTLAARFLAEHPPVDGSAARSIRFDVVAVTGSTIDVIEAAF